MPTVPRSARLSWEPLKPTPAATGGFDGEGAHENGDVFGSGRRVAGGGRRGGRGGAGGGGAHETGDVVGSERRMEGGGRLGGGDDGWALRGPSDRLGAGPSSRPPHTRHGPQEGGQGVESGGSAGRGRYGRAS